MRGADVRHAGRVRIIAGGIERGTLLADVVGAPVWPDARRRPRAGEAGRTRRASPEAARGTNDVEDVDDALGRLGVIEVRVRRRHRHAELARVSDHVEDVRNCVVVADVEVAGGAVALHVRIVLGGVGYGRAVVIYVGDSVRVGVGQTLVVDLVAEVAPRTGRGSGCADARGVAGVGDPAEQAVVAGGAGRVRGRAVRRSLVAGLGAVAVAVGPRTGVSPVRGTAPRVARIRPVAE